MHDYLWRWDTDWFWCSRAFGAQNPLVRRLWPRRLRRSDVYWKLVALDQRFDVADRIDAPRRPPAARAGGPGRRGARGAARRVPRLVRRRTSPSAGLAVPAAAAASRGPAAPGPALAALPAAAPARTYVNVGFWCAVPVGPDAGRAPAQPGDRGRGVTSSAATSRCTPRRSTTRTTSTASTAAPTSAAVKRPLRPRRPADQPLRQGGATTMTLTDSDLARHQPIAGRDRWIAGARRHAAALHGLRRQRGRARRTPAIGLDLRNQRGLTYLLTAPGDLGMARAYVSGDLVLRRRAPRRPLRAARGCCRTICSSGCPAAAEALDIVRSLGLRAPQAAAPAAAGGPAALAPRRRGPAALARRATPRRSATTTTCPTASTSGCSARR